MRILRTEKKTDTEVLVATAVTMSLMKFIKKRQMKLMGYINRGGCFLPIFKYKYEAYLLAWKLPLIILHQLHEEYILLKIN